MATRWDTEHWDFYIEMGFRRTKRLETCKTCHGEGNTGYAPFAWAQDDPVICSECNGDRRMIYDLEPKPKIPEDLYDHLTEAFQDYIHKLDGTYKRTFPKRGNII